MDTVLCLRETTHFQSMELERPEAICGLESGTRSRLWSTRGDCACRQEVAFFGLRLAGTEIACLNQFSSGSRERVGGNTFVCSHPYPPPIQNKGRSDDPQASCWGSLRENLPEITIAESSPGGIAHAASNFRYGGSRVLPLQAVGRARGRARLLDDDRSGSYAGSLRRSA
jgi:hypothetical protein